MRLHLASLLALAPLLTGCPNTDTAIFVDPTIETPAAEISSSALGTSVKGSFKLNLHLGARASGPSTVSMPTFAVQDAKRTVSATIPTDSGSTPFPITVEPDSDVVVSVTFDTGTKLLDANLGTALCDPEGVIITGTIQDSLQQGGTTVESAVFPATGCN